MQLKRLAPSLIFSFALIAALAGLLSGTLQLGGLFLLSPRRTAALAGAAAAAGCFLFFRRPGAELRITLLFSALFWCVALVCSDLVERKFGFYLGAQVRRQIILLGLVALAAAVVFLRKKPGERLPYGEALLLFCQAAAAVSFLQCAQGRLIFSDDHPSFLYRFQELVRHFPNIPYYNTEWNGGFSASEFFATGALGAFFLFLPLLGFAGDFSSFAGSEIYTLLIPYLFVCLIPWSVYLAARLIGLPRQTASIAGIFALGPSLGYFEWILKFGTIGFALSAGMLPLIVALSVRLAFGPVLPRWSEVFAFIIAAYLFLAWPLAVILLAPMGVLWVWSLIRRRPEDGYLPSGRRWARIAVFAGLTALLQLPTALVLIRDVKVTAIAATNSMPGSINNQPSEQVLAAAERGEAQDSSGAKAAAVLKHLQENLVKANPLILLFMLPGFLILGRGMPRRAIFGSVIGALLLHLIGPYYKPQFELRRMIYPALFMAALPAAAAIAAMFDILFKAMFEPGDLRKPARLSIAGISSAGAVALSGLFLISPVTAASVYLNRSIEHFQFAPPLVGELSSAIAAHGGNGRTLFLGFMLHDLGSSGGLMQDGGHIAPLANFSGKPLYAFYYTHYIWTTADPIPLDYRQRGRAGIEEFLDLVNVTAVVTHQKEWADFCRADSRYVEVFKGDRFRLFVRNSGNGSYFLSGAGQIEPAEEGFAVKLDSAEAVLKYRYFPKLRSFPSDGVEIYPVRAFEEDSRLGTKVAVDFVGIRLTGQGAKPGDRIKIGYFEN